MREEDSFLTDPNGGDTQNFEGSGARPGPFRRATPLSPHVSLAIAGIRVKIRGYCPCFATGRKSYAFFYMGEMFVSFNAERRPM